LFEYFTAMDSDNMPVFNETSVMQIPYNIRDVITSLNEIYGDIGHIGEKGPTGEQGIQGPVGLQGAIGPQGPTGNKGPTGDQGPVGAQGPVGPQGPTGLKGATGAEGPRGPVGAQGPVGGTGSSYWQIQPTGSTTNLYYMGNIGITTKTPAYTLDVSGTIRTNALLSRTLTASTSVTSPLYVTSSDYRIKEQVVPLGASENVDQLRPVSYYNKLTHQQEYGLIAHELQEVFPCLVHGEKDDSDIYQSVNYNGIISVLIHEIQQLKRRVTQLENLSVGYSQEKV
jgi:hypothetical protein